MTQTKGMIPITPQNRHTLPLSKIFTYMQLSITGLKVLRKEGGMEREQIMLMTLVGNKLQNALHGFKQILNDKSKKVLADHILNDTDSIQCDALLEMFIAMTPESRERVNDFASMLYDKEVADMKQREND